MIHVMLVDDHDLVRAGLRALLEGESDIEVVAEAGNGSDALRTARRVRPDLMLVDLSMPGGLGGFELSEAILAELPQTKICILSQYGSREYVRRAMRLGAHGYLIKQCGRDELLQAVRSVASGRRFLHPLAASELAEAVANGDEDNADPYDRLTPRERQVVKLLAEGRTSREIARELGISIKTAMTHRANLMGKLNLHSRTELITWALRHHVVHIDDQPS